MDITPHTSYSMQCTEKEYSLITRALAYIAGVEGPKIKEEDIAAAAELNKRLLEIQAAVYRDKLGIVEGKIRKTRGE